MIIAKLYELDMIYDSLKARCAENANFNTHEIANFQKSAKIYTRGNIYVQSKAQVCTGI